MTSRWIVLVVLLLGCRVAQTPLPSSPNAAPPPVRLTFQPQSDTFAAAARAYEELWAAEGASMVAALEAGSGLRFVRPDYADTAITVVVFEGVSSSGYRDEVPMMMRASYSADTKKATLLHELGHRLMGDMFRRHEEPHAALFLWLYDVWIALYGQAFADEQVAVEKRRRGPYPAAWDAATRLSRDERRASWAAIVAQRSPGQRRERRVRRLERHAGGLRAMANAFYPRGRTLLHTSGMRSSSGGIRVERRRMSAAFALATSLWLVASASHPGKG